MRRLFDELKALKEDETGHVGAGVTSLAAAIGAIVLGIGAAADSDIASITGGVVLGVGIFASGVARHRGIDYELFKRLDDLEKK